MPYILYILIILNAALVGISQTLLKVSANREHRGWLTGYINPFVISSYLIYLWTLASNVFLYTKIDYRFSVLFNSLSTVSVMLASRMILKEKLTPRHIIGNAAILLGIAFFVLF